jgi:hypothetical protein
MSHGNPKGLPEAALDAMVSAWAVLVLIIGIAVLLISYRLHTQRKGKKDTRKKKKHGAYR